MPSMKRRGGICAVYEICQKLMLYAEQSLVYGSSWKVIKYCQTNFHLVDAARTLNIVSLDLYSLPRKLKHRLKFCKIIVLNIRSLIFF